jgi:hypothetical protein
MRARVGQSHVVDDQVFLADRALVEPALQDLAHPGDVAGLRGRPPLGCALVPD